jgi:PAS domain S-box-containing protein
MSIKQSFLKLVKKIPPAVFIFLLFASVIYFVTYYDYRDESNSLIKQKYNELSAISELKVKEIENWLWERKSDALVFSNNSIFQKDVLRYLKNTSSEENKKSLSVWLSSLKHNKEYQNIFLTDSACNFLYAASGKPEIICIAEKQNLKKAFQSKDLLVSDLYKKNDGTIYMDIVVPFFTNEGKDSTPVGALFFLVNPQTSFYPLIQSWPTPSKTSETLLVEKCSLGDSIIYLNELRNKKNTSLNFKISLSDTILPAVKAVLGRTGIFKSKDYRGIEVLAISKKIKGTSWYMVTKTDMSEIQEPLKNKTKWFLTLTGLLVLLTTSSLWILWTRRKTKQYKQLYLAIAEKDVAENKFKLFFENSPIGKSITSIDGSIQVNKAFCDMLGYSNDELDNKKFRDITYTEDIAAGDNALEYLLSGKGVKTNFIKRYLHKNGNIVWCEVVTTLQRSYKGQPQFFMTSVNDITDRINNAGKLESQYALLASIINSPSDIIIFSLDKNYCYTSFNEKHRLEMKSVWGVDIKHGTNLLDCMKFPELKVLAKKSIDRAINGESFTEIQYQPDHNIYYEFIWNPVLQNNEVIGATAFIIDITDRKKAENILRESENRYRGLFDNMLNGFAYCKIVNEENAKPDFIYLEVNDAFENLTGLKNVKGKKVSEVIPGIQESDDKLLYLYSKTASTGIPARFEFYVEAMSMWFDISVYSPLENHFVAVFDVITKRKQIEIALQESEFKYRNLFTEMTSAFAYHRIINNERGEAVDYEFIEMNPAFEDLTGMIAQNACGKTAKEILPEIENYWIENYGKVANNGISLSFSNYNKTLNRHYNVYAYCPRKGYFAVIFNDITEQKKVSDKINILNKDLEEKNAELERLIFVASHDLRSPLVNIQGFGGELNNSYNEVKKVIAEVDNINDLRNKLANILDTDIPESINFIELSAQKMNQLISGMLKVSRLGRNEITLAKIDMNKLMSEVSSTFEFIVKKEHIIISIENLPECTADKILIDQLFANLISNSIKFRNPEMQAKISISGFIEDQYSVYCVEDNGIGFSEKYMDNIFLLFHRLNNSIEGEGLGLSIVKKIVDIHKGKIWAKSEVGKGSKFYVALSSK